MIKIGNKGTSKSTSWKVLETVMSHLKMLINDKKYFLVNVHGPNKDAEAIKFFLYLSTTLRAMDFESNDNVIIGGDFNCPLDPTNDKKGGILIPRQHLINE